MLRHDTGFKREFCLLACVHWLLILRHNLKRHNVMLSKTWSTVLIQNLPLYQRPIDQHWKSAGAIWRKQTVSKCSKTKQCCSINCFRSYYCFQGSHVKDQLSFFRISNFNFYGHEELYLLIIQF